MQLTATVASTTYAALEAEWFAAVAARDAFDVRRRAWNAGTTPAGRRSAARSWGARRAPLTRRIIAAEAAIDAYRR
jgi:hypothetical protein